MATSAREGGGEGRRGAVSPLPSCLRVERLAGKGRGLVATTALPAGRLLFTERPLSSSPFQSTSSAGLTPTAIVEELALLLLQDEGAAGYEQLCHHVDQETDPNTALPTSSSSRLRPSPSPLYSSLLFSTAVSQVESNAFATELTRAEAEAWWARQRGQRQSPRPQRQQPPLPQPNRVASDKSQQRGTEEGEEEVDGTEEDEWGKEQRPEAMEHKGGGGEEKTTARRRRRKKKKKVSGASGVQSEAVEANAAASDAATASASSSHDASSLRVLLLYSHVSLLNHSCQPNAAVYWDSSDDPSSAAVHSSSSSLSSLPRVFAIAEVAEGEEVCIAYRADLLHFPTPLRRSLIEQSWHFLCSCQRCSQPAAECRQEQLLLALTRPLTAAEQQRMTTDFAALVAYAEQPAASSSPSPSLSFSPSSPSLHPAMQRRLDAFLELPLAVTHWRLHRIRQLFLPFVLAHTALPYAYKRRLLEAHIRSHALVLPALHPSKLTCLLTLSSLLQLEEDVQPAEALAAMLQLEPAAERLLERFAAQEG